MRTGIALSMFILIFASTVVCAAGGGGENQVTDIQNSDITEVTFSDVFYGNQNFGISVQLDNQSNTSSIQIWTQICVNSGLCYPPNPQDMVKDNATGIWSIEVNPIEDQTYVNWYFELSEGENKTRIPDTGWGWKVWSDCWFDSESWGGENYNENMEGCGEIENTPALGIVGATMSILIAATVIRRR